MSISRGIYNELIYRIGENMGITCILIAIIIVLIAVIIKKINCKFISPLFGLSK